MKRLFGVVAVLSLAAGLALVAAIPLAGSSPGNKIFQFGRLVAVTGALVGSSMPLRGVNGGGLPWVIAEGSAKLMANGEFEVEVEGLVLDPTNATAQSRGTAGTNPLPFFFATLSCVGSDGSVTNINTVPVHASSTGNAEIEQTITLPTSCFAPIVLVRGSATGTPSGPWFAASGF